MESALAAAGGDLVVVALPGVQRFISEARSTADVRAGSEIIARLAAGAAQACAAAGGELVFPSVLGPDEAGGDGPGSAAGMPNRVVAVASPGGGSEVARGAADEVRRLWDNWVRGALKLPGQGASVPLTPGFPLVHWACVPAGTGGYARQWDQAREALDARRRVRDFDEVAWAGRELCSLSPRWPAESPPPGMREHERDRLSAANWVKRRWRRIHDLDGFPSTASVASGCYRRAVAERLADPQVRAEVTGLMTAVRALSDAAGQKLDVPETPVAGLARVEGQPGRWLVTSGGPWMYPETWQAARLAREAGTQAEVIQQAVAAGAAAARQLAAVMAKRHDVPAPASYLAVIVQDLDGMGRFLSGEGASADGERITATAAEHREISGRLRGLAGVQTRILQGTEFLGVPVYAGGDDLLAFAPAATALAAARACHDAVPPALPTATTAVLFFHYHAGLRSAMARARAMLEQAKEAVPGKHALAVGYWRRSGAGEFSVQPWAGQDGLSTAELFGIFGADRAHPLSPRLVADLERDGDELAGLYKRDASLYQAELLRLVRRHTRVQARGDGPGDRPGGAATEASSKAAAALAWLGHKEAAQGSAAATGPRPERAAQVAVFLRQEVR